MLCRCICLNNSVRFSAVTILISSTRKIPKEKKMADAEQILSNTKILACGKDLMLWQNHIVLDNKAYC